MWRVYYEDGTIWDWKQGIAGVPPFGVMCILQKIQNDEGNPHWQIVSHCKYYVYSENEWLHSVEGDIVDYLIHGRTIEKLLVGRMTTHKVFTSVFKAAKYDKDTENL